jgi:hypothetical protein
MFRNAAPRTNLLQDRLRAIAEHRAFEERSKPVVIHVETVRKLERALRQPVYRNGLVLLEWGEKLQVVIKNISATGARIDFFRNVSLPDQVILSESTLKLHTHSRVVWQTYGSAGLAFDTPLQAALADQDD